MHTLTLEIKVCSLCLKKKKLQYVTITLIAPLGKIMVMAMATLCSELESQKLVLPCHEFLDFQGNDSATAIAKKDKPFHKKHDTKFIFLCVCVCMKIHNCAHARTVNSVRIVVSDRWPIFNTVNSPLT